jgi:hypothetical protein
MNPPRNIPKNLFSDYTLNGKINVFYEYFNDSHYHNSNTKICLDLIERARRKETGGYGKTDEFLYEAFSEHLTNKENILIFGSQIPWYEAICQTHGIRKIVISEYNEINCTTCKSMYQYVRPKELKQLKQKFHNLLSISSFEHDGLGRYGEPLNPNADIETMQEICNYVYDDGLLFLSVPIGKDTLVWNAHRIYGKIRLPMLLRGWNLIAEYGFREKCFDFLPQDFIQPIFVLRKQTNYV